MNPSFFSYFSGESYKIENKVALDPHEYQTYCHFFCLNVLGKYTVPYAEFSAQQNDKSLENSF